MVSLYTESYVEVHCYMFSFGQNRSRHETPYAYNCKDEFEHKKSFLGHEHDLAKGVLHLAQRHLMVPVPGALEDVIPIIHLRGIQEE